MPVNNVQDIGSSEFEYTEIPIHFGHDIDLPPQAYIDISINGVSISLPIDTGDSAGCIRLSPSVLSKLNALYTGRTKDTFDGYGQKYSSRQYQIPNIHIGSLHIDHLEDFEFRSRYDTQGVIGLPFLKKYNVLIDYPDCRFGLYKKSSTPAFLGSQSWTRIKLFSPGAGKIIPLRLEGHGETFTFFLDSPSTVIDEDKRSYDLIRSQSRLGSFLNQRGSIELFPTDIGALGRCRSSQFRTLSDYPLAPLDFAIVDVEYPRNDGMLGYNFLQHYSIFIDFMRNEIYLKSCSVR